MNRIVFMIGFVMIYSGALAWGSKGHKIVAAIAKKCLKQAVIDSVDKYLNGMSWEDAGVWMDEIKSDNTYDEFKPWHYLNVDKDKTYVKTDEPNVVNGINKSIEVLSDKNKSKADKSQYLKFLFHLMGDIHQPLHCGYGEDKGGNKVQCQFENKGTNLHHIWDSDLIDASGITLKGCLEHANKMSATEKGAFAKFTVEGIVNESRELLPAVYDFERKITQSYIDKNKSVIEKQLIKAGVRLAYCLTNGFEK